jgi:hypothetical protein
MAVSSRAFKCPAQGQALRLVIELNDNLALIQVIGTLYLSNHKGFSIFFKLYEYGIANKFTNYVGDAHVLKALTSPSNF